MNVRSVLGGLRRLARLPTETDAQYHRLLAVLDSHKILQGRIAGELLAQLSPRVLADIEFKVFSQFGDDGII